ALPAVAEAELGGRRRAHGVAELAEEERLPERRGELAVVLREVHRVERREAGRWRKGHPVVPVLVVPLVRAEEVQPVPDDGAADAGAAQVAFVGRLLEPGGIGRLVRQLEGVERHRASALEGEERVPLPGIAARLGRGRDQRARRLDRKGTRLNSSHVRISY